VYRRALLLERYFENPLPEGTSPIEVTIQRLDQSEVEAYAEFQPNTDLPDVRKRLQGGHDCYAAWHKDRIVYVLWGVTGSAWIDYLACTIQLAPKEIYLYASYTRPEYRGQNIPVVLVAKVFQKLIEDGFRRGFGVVVPENRPAVRHAEKGGWKPCGLIGYYKLGPFRRDFCRMQNNSLPPGETHS
jgi:GNAT superfamily N-acetyltransferase